MLCLQVDILHPLTTLEWEQCGQVPWGFRDHSTKFVALGEKIYMSSDTHLYVSTDLNSWTEICKLPAYPGYQGTLTTYRSQLVLGYKERNKLWTLSEAGVWQESLPPMSTEISHPVVVSATDPECLIVMGSSRIGWYTGESFMEVLIGDQWFVAEHPPSYTLKGGVVHNGMLYVHGRGTGAQIFCCDFRSLIESCRHPDPNSPLRWSEIRLICDPISILSFGQQLVMVCENRMFAYQPLTDGMPWVFLGLIPISALSTFLHAGGLFITYQQYRYSKIKILRLALISKCSA